MELIDDAVDDLARYAETGTLPLFLKKLIHLEEAGRDAGLPLGRGLAGWKKIVVGNRDWRITFTVDPDETTATIWVIGDRTDAECYEMAHRRVAAIGRSRPQASSLAAVMFQISQARRTSKKKR